MWVSENEGEKYRLCVLTELQNRGVKYLLIACVDALTGFAEALSVTYQGSNTALYRAQGVSFFTACSPNRL